MANYRQIHILTALLWKAATKHQQKSYFASFVQLQYTWIEFNDAFTHPLHYFRHISALQKKTNRHSSLLSSLHSGKEGRIPDNRFRIATANGSPTNNHFRQLIIIPPLDDETRAHDKGLQIIAHRVAKRLLRQIRKGVKVNAELTQWHIRDRGVVDMQTSRAGTFDEQRFAIVFRHR
mmetsp:Transcript_26606/g.41297  ORF Transcript_26606/g.41297 Transcript_26606/m.41297 type:complete len:177 (+) Transcript_26606:80-610(+)